MHRVLPLAASFAVACTVVSCEPRIAFTESEVDHANLGAMLPRGFMFGVATAAHQVEGGNTNNDWYDFESGHQPDGSPNVPAPSGRACDSWNRWSEDQDHVQWLHANTYRLSLEWSRIEPSPGVWDTAVIAHYRAQLESLRARGIRPMVTIHHYTFPRWVAAHGGWEWDGLGDAFDTFTRRLGHEYGDLVDTWITVNEPNATVAAGYVAGIWPPGVRDLTRAWNVYVNIMRGHARIAHAIRESDTVDADGDGRATFIGMAHNITLFQSGTAATLDSVFSSVADDTFNEAVPRAVQTGHMRFQMPGSAPFDVAIPELVGTFDYFGIQYYRRDMVRADLLGPSFYSTYILPNRLLSDDAREIYPEGLYRTLMRYTRYGWPIIITENGVADEHDTVRSWYLRSHLYAIGRAVQDGANVIGYVHWSLMDNWEWAQGINAHYGLFAVDFTDPNLPRSPRPSASVFRDIAMTLEEPR